MSRTLAPALALPRAVELRRPVARGPALRFWTPGIRRAARSRGWSGNPSCASARRGRRLLAGLAGQLDAGRDGGVGGDPLQPAQLVRAQPQDVVQPWIGVAEIERVVERPAPAQHPGRQLVGQAPVALRQHAHGAIARVRERRPGADGAQNIQGRATRGGRPLNPASPRAVTTAWRRRAAASAPPETRPVPPRPRGAWHGPWRRGPARRPAPCSSGCRPLPAPW